MQEYVHSAPTGRLHSWWGWSSFRPPFSLLAPTEPPLKMLGAPLRRNMSRLADLLRRGRYAVFDVGSVSNQPTRLYCPWTHAGSRGCVSRLNYISANLSRVSALPRLLHQLPPTLSGSTRLVCSA